jgi:hypothetical protein
MVPLFKKLLAKSKPAQKNKSSSQNSPPLDSSESPLTSRSSHEKKHPGILVVVGNESIFPRPLIDYAVDMAHRLSYEIVALNTAPLSCETFKLFSSSRKKVCEEFKELAEKNVYAFKKEVEQHNIPFTHVVKFCETDQAIDELQTEIGDIDFIVSDSQADHDFEVSMDQEMPRCEVFVYAMS